MIRSDDINFYAEVILISIISIVTAGIWGRWLEKVVNYYYPNNFKIEFLLGLIFTILAIIVFSNIFSTNRRTNNSPYDSSNSEKK